MCGGGLFEILPSTLYITMFDAFGVFFPLSSLLCLSKAEEHRTFNLKQDSLRIVMLKCCMSLFISTCISIKY